jgi:hypothetical protein
MTNEENISTDDKKRVYFRNYMPIYFKNNPDKALKNKEQINRNYWLKKALLYLPKIKNKPDLNLLTYLELKKLVQMERQRQGKLKNG